MKSKKLLKILVIFIGIGVVFGVLLIALSASTSPVLAQDVCPEGGDWVKVEISPYEHTELSGKIIEAICVKGGKEGTSQGGYLHTFNSDGDWLVDGKVCLSASGIGTTFASVSHGDAPKNVCADISHASFKLGDPKEEPTPTNTQPTKEETPTDTPTPTPTNTEQEKEETPTPTATGTVNETEPPKEATPTNTQPPEEPTNTPHPTEPYVEPPDEAAGGQGPSFASIFFLVMLSGGGLASAYYLINKIRKA